MQHEFAAALYQLMTQSRRIEEDDPHGPKSPTVHKTENNTNSNPATPSKEDQTIIANGISKPIIEGKSNVEKTVKSTESLNGLSLRGKCLLKKKKKKEILNFKMQICPLHTSLYKPVVSSVKETLSPSHL